MEREKLIDKFSAALIFVTRLFSHTEDKFFIKKLYAKNQKLVRSFISSSNNLTAVLDEISELIEEMRYLKLAELLPLLQAQKHLLEFKFAILKSASSVRAGVPNLGKNVSPLSKKGANLNPNKEKILNFVRQKKTVRAKEIVDSFSVISVRTVKRNLKELTEEGLLGKKWQNRSMYYFDPGYKQ